MRQTNRLKLGRGAMLPPARQQNENLRAEIYFKYPSEWYKDRIDAERRRIAAWRVEYRARSNEFSVSWQLNSRDYAGRITVLLSIDEHYRL